MHCTICVVGIGNAGMRDLLVWTTCDKFNTYLKIKPIPSRWIETVHVYLYVMPLQCGILVVHINFASILIYRAISLSCESLKEVYGLCAIFSQMAYTWGFMICKS